MNPLLIKIIETVSLIIIALAIRFIVKKTLQSLNKRLKFHEKRRTMISKVINMTINILASIIVFGIWGIEQGDIAIYFVSVFTIIGVAFFAQWSHLSNITASLILYFSNPVGIGDEISIYDGEKPIEGTIVDIGVFYIKIRTGDKKQLLISNTIFLQKIVALDE